MTKRTKLRRVMISIILQNLKKISTEVYKLKPFEIAMLVKFDFGGQNSCFDKAVLLIKKTRISRKYDL